MTKRALDLALGSATATLIAPLLGVLGVLVRSTSDGPALFVQERVGKNRQRFLVFKLRTMHTSTEGPEVTQGGDARVTALGRWLRLAKLDELPQLWNVLRGDMSLVGPRPEVPRYVAHYRPEWEAVFTVQPGLTDEASLAFRDEEGVLKHALDPERAYVEIVVPLKMNLALKGIERSSLRSDLWILAKTALRVVHPRSTEHPSVAEARLQIDRLNSEIEGDK